MYRSEQLSLKLSAEMKNVFSDPRVIAADVRRLQKYL